MKPKLTRTQIENAIRQFYEEHGRHPHLKDGDASPQMGEDVTWGAVNASLRKGLRGLPPARGLAEVAEKMGIKDSKPDLTVEAIREATKSFYADHLQFPNQRSGDASPYFGYSITWSAVDHALREGIRGFPGGESLALSSESTWEEGPKFKFLRPYQWDAVYHVTAQIADGQRELGIQAPTGSGKSLMITTILAKVMGRFFQSAIVAAPAVQIEDGFFRSLIIEGESGKLAGSASRIHYEINRGEFFLRPRKNNLEANLQMLKDHVRAKSPEVPVLLTTHQQVTRWATNTLPDDLTGRLFIADEAHRAGLSDSDSTQLALFLEAWKEREGTVIYVTATPFRSNGWKVFPDGMDPYTWTISQHSATGEFAPKNFEIRTAIIEGADANSVSQLAGDTLSHAEDRKGMSFLAMIEQWEKDGRPKAVFIVPGRNSINWTQRFKDLLEERNPETRILDVVGVGNKIKKSLTDTLKYEQNVERYEDSLVDVVLACRRFDEGTDWPLCSHVYNYGIPSSFMRILQRWGRAFRSKKGIDGYPEDHVENAHIVFFVPKVKKNVLKQFEDQHHDHACLLACYMADWETARDFGLSLRIRFEKHFKRMRQWEAKKKEEGNDPERQRIKDQQTIEVSDLARAEAIRLLSKYEASLERPPTVEEAHAYVDTLGLDEESLQAVHAVIASTKANEEPGVIDNADDLMGTMGEVTRAEVTRVYREAVAPWRHQTFSVLGATQKVCSKFTGLDAGDLAERLRDRVVKPNLTMDMIERAVLAFHKDHGRPPTSGDGDATKYFDFPETWAAVNGALSSKGRGLK